jgi:hypothetical protein
VRYSETEQEGVQMSSAAVPRGGDCIIRRRRLGPGRTRCWSAAGCPPAFQGPLTFAEIMDRWPPPPDLPDPEGVLVGFDINDDRMLCVMETPEAGMVPAPINVIDNFAAT